jgi:hypothetical protein
MDDDFEKKQSDVLGAILALSLTAEEKGQLYRKMKDRIFVLIAYDVIKKNGDLAEYLRTSLGKLFPSPISQ